MKYITHGWHNPDIKIDTIENGFIITYTELITKKQKHVKDMDELTKFLMGFYRVEK